MLPLTFSDDDHANVFRRANDSQNQIGAQQTAPGVIFGPAYEYLRDLIATRKIDDRFCRVIAFQDPCFDMKVSGEVQVLFDRLRPLRTIVWAR